MLDWVVTFVIACWSVTGQMAPYLLFGFLMAGGLSIFLSPAWVERHLGGRGLGPVLKSAIFGVPLPLCSCGVIPVAASLRQQGASRGATTAFLLSTPQTGVDSILATYALLGPVFMVFRVVVAFLTGVVGGGLVSFFDRDLSGEPKEAKAAARCADGCDTGSVHVNALKKALRYGLMTLPRDIARPLVIGILAAGALSVFFPQDVLAPYLGGGLLAMVLMIGLGIPLYVCATASIPVALGFMHLGASPGAALAFLIAGPATNTATISVVWQLMGRRTAVIYFLTVGLGALAAGLVLDSVYANLAEAGVVMGLHHHVESGGWFGHLSGVVLLGVLAWSVYGPRFMRATAVSAPLSSGFRLTVTGMTCSHCADAVSRALREVPGVLEVQVDLGGHQAVVTGSEVTADQLLAAVEKAGYHATPQ